MIQPTEHLRQKQQQSMLRKWRYIKQIENKNVLSHTCKTESKHSQAQSMTLKFKNIQNIKRSPISLKKSLWSKRAKYVVSMDLHIKHSCSSLRRGKKLLQRWARCKGSPKSRKHTYRHVTFTWSIYSLASPIL